MVDLVFAHAEPSGDHWRFFILRESVITKKYTNTIGKDSKYTNTIDISIIWSCGVGRGWGRGITCRRKGRRRRRRGRKRRLICRGGGSWVSSCIFYFSLFVYVSCNFLPRSCLLRSFVTFCDVLSMFILRVQRKRVGASLDPIFEHPVFDSAREKMKRFIKQLRQEAF